MDAIIYAAGSTTRIGTAYSSRPNILLVIVGKSLLEWNMQRLAQARISHVFVVTGHLREQVSALIPDLRKRYHIAVEELFNPDFGEGSVISVNVSLPIIAATTESILLMDGDVFYDRAVLQHLL